MMSSQAIVALSAISLGVGIASAALVVEPSTTTAAFGEEPFGS